jgi:hypothetical protein
VCGHTGNFDFFEWVTQQSPPNINNNNIINNISIVINRSVAGSPQSTSYDFGWKSKLCGSRMQRWISCCL